MVVSVYRSQNFLKRYIFSQTKTLSVCCLVIASLVSISVVAADSSVLGFGVAPIHTSTRATLKLACVG